VLSVQARISGALEKKTDLLAVGVNLG